MLYQLQDEIDDDGMPIGPVTGCEDDDEGDWMDSPTDFDEYEMNADDCALDACDPYDIEYDH